MDINPLICSATGCTAVDALMIVEPAEGAVVRE
jgi:hypothetical protein